MGDAAGGLWLATGVVGTICATVAVAIFGVIVCTAAAAEVAILSGRSVTEVSTAVDVANATSPFPALNT